MKKKYRIIAIISVVALTCWGIGEMALKTGYKVNDKEIILDDYSKYGDSSIIDTCTKTLDNYYKINGKDIKASYYVEGKGQIPAELPGDSYYKTPSGVQRFALYGTNTVGGWINGAESNHWKKFEGNDVGGENKVINIMFDGQKLGIAEIAGESAYYIPNDDDHIIRKYVDDNGKYVYPSDVKIWVYATAAGGGGGAGYPQVGGGGGGASGIACIRMSTGDVIVATIPKSSRKGEAGGDLSLTLNKPSTSPVTLLTLGGGKAGGNLSSGDGGDSTYKGTTSYNLINVFTIKGGKGGEVGRGEDESNAGQGISFYPNTKADYYILYKSLTIAGGTGKSTHTTSMAFNMGGGGASAFPRGEGGRGTFVGNWDEETYNAPGPGGGGGGAYGADNNYGYSGAGAFWLLYA